MFQPSTHLLEIVLRVLIVYVGLFVLLRLVGKKELGQLAPMDFLAMLIVSETVSPALTNEDPSLTAALTAAATLIGITWLVDWATFRWPTFGRAVEGKAQVVIDDGKVVRAVQQREKLSDADLASALRREGVEDPNDVKRATVETTGRITVIQKE